MRSTISVALAAACLLLPPALALGQGTAPAQAGIPTAVLVDQSLGELHYLSRSTVPHVDTTQYPAAYNYSPASIVGAGLGGLVVQLQMMRDAQRSADLAVFDLVEPLGKSGLEGPVRDAFREALPQHGMSATAVVFTGGAKLDRKHFPRISAARQAKRFMLVGSGEEAETVMLTPLGLDVSLRQLRVALDIEFREGTADRNKLLSRRDVVVYSQPVDVPDNGNPLDILGADDQALFRSDLNKAIAMAIGLATVEREFPKVGKDDEVGVVNDLGLTEFRGAVLEEKEGRALIWTRNDSLVSIPSERVVSGEALVAARLEQATRSKPTDVVSEEQVKAMGGAETAPDAPPQVPEA